MAGGGSHIAVFIILGSLEERMRKLQSLQAARFSRFSQRSCWKPGWRNWSDFSLNHHIFFWELLFDVVILGMLVLDSTKFVAQKVCLSAVLGYSMVFIFPQQMGSEGYSQRYVLGWDAPKCLKMRVGWWQLLSDIMAVGLWCFVHKTPHYGIAASFALVFWSEALSLDIACVLSPWLVSATTWPSSTRSRNQQCRSSERRAVRQCRLFAFVMWENQE